MLRAANCFLLNQRGATAIEYGLIAALISIAIIAGITMTGTDMGNTFNNLGNSLD
ncbi:MAG: Flp family type IVb pilin [Rhodospirillales bacterium]|nr:Flp family type IVb pilin [Rhodospirillales bacterium]